MLNANTVDLTVSVLRLVSFSIPTTDSVAITGAVCDRAWKVILTIQHAHWHVIEASKWVQTTLLYSQLKIVSLEIGVWPAPTKWFNTYSKWKLWKRSVQQKWALIYLLWSIAVCDSTKAKILQSNLMILTQFYVYEMIIFLVGKMISSVPGRADKVNGRHSGCFQPVTYWQDW